MAGLDALPDATSVARIVRAATGLDARDMQITGKGWTRLCWRVETDEEPLAVVVAIPEPSDGSDWGEARLESEFAILSRLSPLDDRVPRPFATNRSNDVQGLAPTEVDWLVTTYAPGTLLANADPADVPAPEVLGHEVGTLLAKLHALPVSGFGMLDQQPEVLRERLHGTAPDRLSAMLSRWPVIWPFDGSALISHPITRSAPQFLEPLGALREPLLRFAEVGESVITHDNLNAANITVEGGHLASVIDFGDAFVGPPSLDFSRLAVRHGWVAARSAVESYESNTIMREVRLAEAHQLAVAEALARIAAYAGDSRASEMTAFLEETLPLALAQTRAV